MQVPIQVIDASFGTLPAGCTNPDQSPSLAGFNGLLGLSIFAQDCGSQCATSPDNGLYYSCSGSSCTPVAVALSAQVPNPVLFLPRDNNGVIVQLPNVPAAGSLSATGAVVLGIGTEPNNQVPTGVATYSVDQYGDFVTVLGGQSYSAFLDTGSNGLFFPPTSSSALPTCPCPAGTPPSECVNYTSWFCPPSTVGLTATNTGATGSPSGTVTFQIANYDSFLNGPNSVFGNIGGPALPSEGFDWGLPFHFGLDVYYGLEGTTSGLGTGPFFAY